MSDPVPLSQGPNLEFFLLFKINTFSLFTSHSGRWGNKKKCAFFSFFLVGVGCTFCIRVPFFPVELCAGVQTQTMALPVGIPITAYLTLQDPLVLVGEYLSRRTSNILAQRRRESSLVSEEQRTLFLCELVKNSSLGNGHGSCYGLWWERVARLTPVTQCTLDSGQRKCSLQSREGVPAKSRWEDYP